MTDIGGAMNRRIVLGASILLIACMATWCSALGQEGAREPKPEKVKAASWAAQVTGRHYYLKNPRNGLLTNDQVDVVRCVIRYSPDSDLNTGEVRDAYRAKLWFQGVSPAPPEQFRLTVENFEALTALDDWLSDQFSTTPLEDAYPWPPEIKLAVRYRYLALGMDKDMVALALGGLGYQVDLEKLDDGRIRETWKLQVSGDTRRIFTRRSTFMSTLTSQSSEVFGTISSITQVLTPRAVVTATDLQATGSSSAHSSTAISESGSFVFSGLPPQFLHIVFTDGKVTARRTEFVK